MPKQALGIELGNQHLAIVQLNGTAKNYDVVATHYQSLARQADPEAHIQQCQHALEEAFETHHLRGDTIFVTLPAAQGVLRNLNLPFRDSRRIRQILTYTLDEHMPFEPDEVLTDFQVLEASTADVTPILAAAVSQDLMANTLEMLNKIDLEPLNIDFDVFGLANLALLGTEDIATHTMLVDVHPSRGLIVVLNQGIPIFARSWAHNWPETELELGTYAARLSKQLQRTIYACENSLQQSFDLEQLMLSGLYGESLETLSTSLRTALGVPIVPYRLAADAYRSDVTSFNTSEHANTAVAFGSALRGLQRQSVGLNFRRGRFALHRDLQELRGQLIMVGGLLILLAGMGISTLYLNNYFKNQHLAQLQAHIEQLFTSTIPNTRMVQPVFQLKGKVEEISGRLRAFGGVKGAQLSSLQILREISVRAPKELQLNVETLTITSTTVDLRGNTGSYDDVVKLEGALKASPVFSNVKIISTTKGEAHKVAFKLTLTIAQRLENIT